ncbi:MAG: pyridoxal-dependent decarboxylase [Phycisphaerales bacterium]
MTPRPGTSTFSGWFAGPKAENGDRFAHILQRIVQDYYSWRRNYFPEDGVVIDSAAKRAAEPFHDAFEDRLTELLGRLKNDFPFHSPRYAAHMLSEQTLPSIAGLFAGMLYNPNNVSFESAPVTVRLEVEAAQMIARMLGYGPSCWAHLTGGGTVANLEALWVARTVRYLPMVIRDMRRAVGLPAPAWPDGPRGCLRLSPSETLRALAECFREAEETLGAGPETTQRLIRAYLDSPFCIVERGAAAVFEAVGSSPVLVVPETHHYCFEKALDVLGLGRRALARVRVDSDFRMMTDDLASVLDRIEDEGRHPLAVVAVVGSTEEGAIDPLNEILDLRARREAAGLGSFWVHADAAYRGGTCGR